MSKFHINSAGEVGVCKAVKGNCPFGGADSHFDTAEAAQAYLNKVNHEEYGILSTDESNAKSLMDIDFDNSEEIAMYSDSSNVDKGDLSYAINMGSTGKEQYVRFLERAISNPNNKITDSDVVKAFSELGAPEVKNELIAATIVRLDNKYQPDLFMIGNTPILNKVNYAEMASLQTYSDTADSNELEWLTRAGVKVELDNPNLTHNSIVNLGKHIRFNSDFETLYNHPNATDETKAELTKLRPDLAKNIDFKGSGMTSTEFKDKLTVDTSREKVNLNGTLNEYSFKLDQDMVSKHNLSKEDMDDLFGFSHSSEYDEKSGVYRQTIDSSD